MNEPTFRLLVQSLHSRDVRFISNRRIPLDLDWVQQVRVNTSAVERRALAMLPAAP